MNTFQHNENSVEFKLLKCVHEEISEFLLRSKGDFRSRQHEAINALQLHCKPIGWFFEVPESEKYVFKN